jgi:two-component system, NarL family, nitrate/nitrite sensor histidine kinase NarX
MTRQTMPTTSSVQAPPDRAVGRDSHAHHSGRHPHQPNRRILRILRSACMVGPLLVLLAGLLGSLVLLLLHWRVPASPLLQWLCLGFLAMSFGGMGLAGLRLRNQLLRPLVNLEESVARVCQGEPGASEALQHAGVLNNIARDIGSLNEELTDLYEDMDSRVARQTMRLAQKTASIKILYDVAASINQAQSLDELLLRFLRVIKGMVNGRAATVRLVLPDGTRRLVGSIGLDDDLVRDSEAGAMDLCLCGNVLSAGDIVCSNDARFCSRIYGRRMFGSDEMEVVTVPLEHHDELLGVYTVFVDKPGVTGREDIMELLFSVGHHLGIAVAKHRSDSEARRLSILEERNALAHELHDSLAQTLASLRFQVKMLADSLAGSHIPDAARSDLERLRNGLDEAHTELRELLTSFRAPVDRRGLAPALERLTEHFRNVTGAHVLFQNNCRPFDLPATTELQVLRIAQEALANARKHANAHTVRVLLTRSGSDYVLLVEDDGAGFSAPRAEGSPGEHIGLSIMQERARRVGAELRIESEPGEGTRVELAFSADRKSTPERRVA